MPLEIVQIPVLNDNYVYLLREPQSGAVGVVDPAVHEPVLAELKRRNWVLTHVLNTHHHPDHVGGNMALKDATGCKVIGPEADADRIPGLDIAVGDNEGINLGDETARVFDVPGHTKGHIAYWFADSQALFCGDTLFALGCGRLFEGTPEQMYANMRRFEALPDDTRVYCAHEYTLSNGKYALRAEPENAAVQARMAKVEAMRARGEATVPTTIGEERATNPFLRADSVEELARRRAEKDKG